MSVTSLVFALLVALAVYADARAVGIRKGLLPGFFDMGAGAWAIGCFLLMLIVLPAYLFKRGEYKRVIAQRKAEVLYAQSAPPGSAGQVWPPPPQDPGPG